jgi:hypothetical protein
MTMPPPGVGSMNGCRRTNGTRLSRRITNAGMGTSSWSHSMADSRGARSRSQRVRRLNPNVTNSHA